MVCVQYVFTVMRFLHNHVFTIMFVFTIVCSHVLFSADSDQQHVPAARMVISFDGGALRSIGPQVSSHSEGLPSSHVAPQADALEQKESGEHLLSIGRVIACQAILTDFIVVW